MDFKPKNIKKIGDKFNSTAPIFGMVLPILSEFSTKQVLSENYLLKDSKDFVSKITKTKIIATLGPESSSDEMIGKLLDKGMSIARFNFSHGLTGNHRETIKALKRISEASKKACAVMIDTRGCAIRLAEMDGAVVLNEGDVIQMKPPAIPRVPSDSKTLYVEEIDVLKMANPGEKITIGYGLIELEVLKVTKEHIDCKVLTKGVVSSSKTVFLPRGRRQHPQELCACDYADIEKAIELGADFVSASYITNGDQVKKIRSLLDKHDSHIQIISKIECEEALKNFESILAESDGILISRGNLGEEIDREGVILAQKLIIRKCNAAGKPVITATQMLESMCINPFPTRAEASDGGNAVFDGTDCVMLSGETAIGAYPVEAVKMMSEICIESERSVNHKETFRMVNDHTLRHNNRMSISEAIANSAVKMSFDIKAAAILVICPNIQSGRLLSKYRPKCPIILATDNERVYKQSLISRGVFPIYAASGPASPDCASPSNALQVAKNHGLCCDGDSVVVVNGDECRQSSCVEVEDCSNLIRVVTV